MSYKYRRILVKFISLSITYLQAGNSQQIEAILVMICPTWGFLVRQRQTQELVVRVVCTWTAPIMHGGDQGAESGFRTRLNGEIRQKLTWPSKKTVFVPVSHLQLLSLAFPSIPNFWEVKKKKKKTQHPVPLLFHPSPTFLPPRTAAFTSCLVWGCAFF